MEALVKMPTRAPKSSNATAIAWICALLWTFANAATASPVAAEEKNPNERGGFVTSWDGAEIHYLEAGPSKLPAGVTKENGSITGSNPSILFVPGFTMPAWIWEKQIARFSGDYRVVAMDLRSQGESSKTGEGDYPASHGRDIKAVIDQLHLAPVVLVGWSMGVTLNASYVDQFGTSSLAGIVMVDGMAGVDLTPEFTSSSIEFLKGLQTNRSQLTDAFVRSMFRKPQSEEYVQKLIKASLATPSESAIAVGLASFTTDNRPALAKIDKPTMIAGATKEILTQLQAMQKSISGAKLEFLTMPGTRFLWMTPTSSTSCSPGF
jgi:microsomal epoxide hydrolase